MSGKALALRSAFFTHINNTIGLSIAASLPEIACGSKTGSGLRVLLTLW
jgi:hypothetical protein